MKKRSQKKLIIGFIVFLLSIVVISGIVIINDESFKRFFITSTMTSKSHKYWARLLYSDEVIEEVMKGNYVEEVEEKVHLEDIVIGKEYNKVENKSKYEKEILTKDKENDLYKIIRIETKKFKGYLTVVYDPSDIELVVSSNLGKKGESVNNLVKNNNGIVGINGGGFEDYSGFENGSLPYGAIIKDAKVIWKGLSGSGELIGFTKENKLYFSKSTPEVAIKEGMVKAIEFGPLLIVNGKASKVHGDGGWGIAPRTAIAQRQDGIVLFLVIEGRLPGYSLGADMNDLIETFLLIEKYI